MYMYPVFLRFSLVMVNLIVAIIISDLTELKRQVRMQDTLNKVNHVMTYHTLLSIHPSVAKKEVCIHQVCFQCNAIKVPENVQQELIEIGRRIRKEKLEENII